jgi:hypothetical protein
MTKALKLRDAEYSRGEKEVSCSIEMLQNYEERVLAAERASVKDIRLIIYNHFFPGKESYLNQCQYYV